jgi:hypothetical protein
LVNELARGESNLRAAHNCAKSRMRNDGRVRLPDTRPVFGRSAACPVRRYNHRVGVRRTGLALVVAAWTLVAHAAPDNTRHAKEAFIDGMSFFNLGKFDKAIEKWEEGYQAKQDPIFLYNIAQAHRLKGDSVNALFFYRNYLRTAPQAPNRDEVEEKIRKLEAAIEAQKRTRESPPDELLPPAGANAKKPKPEPPKPEPPKPEPPAPAKPEPAAPAVTVTMQRPERHRADISVAGGVHIWALGLPGGVDPAFGFSVGGGYDVWARGRLTLRVGAKLGYSFVRDVGSTVSLVSVLAEPMLRVRLWRERLFGFVAVGLGGLILDGVQQGSGFLVSHTAASGALAAFELRPALGLEYRPHPRLALFLVPEVVYSPSPDTAFLDGVLLRFAVNLGAAVRL